MKHIEINIGQACNHKCIFCMSWMTREKLLWFEHIDSLKKEISKLKDLWYDSIWFLWWEPTIHPNFLELIEYTKGFDFKNIEVITNWSRFHDEKYLLKAIKAWLTRVSVSIHSVNNKQESLLTGGIPGVLKQKIKAINNILYFHKKWLLFRELSVNIVISKVNYQNIKQLILFLSDIWVKSFRLNYIQLEWYSVSHYPILAIKHEIFTPYLVDIINTVKKMNINVNFEAIPWCYSGLNYQDFLTYSEQNIDREKDKISRDDINLESRDIMNQMNRRMELKSYIKKCDTCFLQGECEWLWNRYLAYFKEVK